MKAGKILKIILNIAIVITALLLLVTIGIYKDSFSYVNKDMAKEYEEKLGVFEYKLKHKAYGEIVDSYFTARMYSLTAPEELEITYLVADYANTAFLRRVYAEKGDVQNENDCTEKLNSLRSRLGDHTYTADEIDAIIGP
ncbi:MAG: hypothetical protein K5686_07160 [Lachnospiraceae bacterium]|nr:hypothetical protein [Lachnospiraceae bacterium]